MRAGIEEVLGQRIAMAGRQRHRVTGERVANGLGVPQSLVIAVRKGDALAGEEAQDTS